MGIALPLYFGKGILLVRSLYNSDGLLQNISKGLVITQGAIIFLVSKEYSVAIKIGKLIRKTKKRVRLQKQTAGKCSVEV